MTWAQYWKDLKKFAFGWMGLDPQKFYEMDNEDFFLKMEGFKDKIIDQKRDMRRMALIIVSPHAQDMQGAKRAWPIEKDDELEDEIQKQKAITQEQHNQNFKRLVGMFKKSNPN